MANAQSIRAVFGSRTFSQEDSQKAGAFSEFGYVPDGDPVPEEYLCRISSYQHRATVVAPLQESITLHVESFWAPAIPTGIFDLANKVFQFTTGGRMSAITKATSRRIWQGSRPIVITLKLTFHAIEDAVKEVVMPTKLLQSIALPRGPLSQQQSKGLTEDFQNIVPFLAPPGPTPYTTSGILSLRSVNESRAAKFIEKESNGGDKIMVEIGRFLTFSNVVVISSTPVIPIAFTKDGDPVHSEVSVTFETYEMMTVDDLNNAYRKTTVTERYSSGEGA